MFPFLRSAWSDGYTHMRQSTRHVSFSGVFSTALVSGSHFFGVPVVFSITDLSGR